MCERDGCQLLNSANVNTTTLATTNTTECKCQKNFYVNMQQQQQQPQQHDMQMSFSTNYSSGSSSATSTNIHITTDSSSHTTSSPSSAPASPTSSTASSITSNASTTTTTSSSTSPSIGVNLRVTGQCSQGGRKYMEDYFSVAYQQSENAKDLEYAFIGIFDGHGGAEAAKFAKEHLMMEIINQKLFWSDSDQDVMRAIREGYIATHYAMWREQDKWPKTANGLPSTAGTTATVAFIRREKIYIGHVGDSGIVLGYQNEHEKHWRAQNLTTDHKPESLAERTRIMRAGGKVIVKSGVPRVVWNRPRNAGHRGPIRRNTLVDEIPFLAVARSLGDLWSYNSARNEFVVSPDPDVKVIKINPKTFKCLIFGTDGLWNVVSAQEAVQIVNLKEKINERLQASGVDSTPENTQWTNPSKGLVDKALQTWSSKKMRADNTSVVTVILYPPNSSACGGDADNSICNNNSISNPLPCSYGLEYTRVNAVIPDYDDEITTPSYQEMAEKYTPPEEYRNFNYYADDNVDEEEMVDIKSLNAQEGAEIDPILLKYNGAGVSYWRNVCCDKTDGITMYADGGGGGSSEDSLWDWSEKASKEYNSENSIMHAAANSYDNEANADGDDEEDEEDEDEDEEDDDDNVDEAPAAEESAESTEILIEAEPCVTNYAQYLAVDTSTTCASAEDASANGNYMHTFAESYNSLLNEQMSQEEEEASSTSSSNAAYQSISGSSMHEILQEQQLYQQQCMSEEEGYSLTKLETRREQQRCINGSRNNESGVQTFKIFQQHATQQTSLPTTLAQAATGVANYQSEVPATLDATVAPFYEAPCPTIQAALTKYIAYQQQEQQSSLELNSLLQQEREEEQQVALEQLEKQRQIANAHKYAESTTQEQQAVPVSANDLCENDETLVEEYLEEELEESMTLLPHDESVQINEISSSSLEELNKGADVEQQAASSATVIEKIKKIEILNVCATAVTAQQTVKSRKLMSTQQRSSSSAVGGGGVTSTAVDAMLVKRSRTHFPNIPNENQRLSLSVATQTLNKCNTRRRLNHFDNASSTATAAATLQRVNCMEKRQLRSSVHLDYSKRTLRTRNSLSRDMKAKTALLQSTSSSSSSSSAASASAASLKRSASAVTSHFLRNAGVVNLLKATTSAKSTEQILNNSIAHHSTANRLSIKKVSEKTEKLAAMLACSSALNLRSRQIGQLTANGLTLAAPSITNTLVTTSTTTSAARTCSYALRRGERRNLRSSKESLPSMTSNFSKTTRLQSTSGTMLAAPPPSPKLINAAAAVAAATRARSLLAKGNAAVKSVFLKRASLRSGSGSSATTNSPAAATTRGSSGRVAKKLKR